MFKTTIQYFLCAMLLMSSFLATAQTKDDKRSEILKNLNFKTYGVLNYYNLDLDSDPLARNIMDTERLNTYIYYDFSDKIQFKAEIEIEHSGTGSTMELDKLEEFGEYEAEIEAGGEVKLEQLNILFKVKPWLNFKVGRIKLYMGNASKIDIPNQYFTGQRSSMENTLLPLGWYENGVEVLGKFGNKQQFSYKAYLVNGLNSQGFSSANWIKRGHQQRFETLNADGLAVAGRFDYILPNKSGYAGVSGYFGDTNANRYKNDLKNTEGFLSLFDAHVNIVKEDWRVHGMVLYGNLQNSDRIALANRNLSNALNVKRTPVAKNALGYYLEAGYNVFALLNKDFSHKLFAFGRYDFYDSMYQVTGNTTDNPRWERKVATFGMNYFVHPGVVFKAHYAVNTLGENALDAFGNPIGNKDKTFLLGLAFTFKSN